MFTELFLDFLNQGRRACSCFPHCSSLLISISISFGISKGSSNLAILSQVQGSNFLSFFNLLLVALYFALKLINQSLHALMVHFIFITCESEFLNGALRLAKILANVTITTAFSIQFRLQLSDASFHLNHGLSSSLQSIDLCFISTGTSILALGLKKLFILLQVHGNFLLTTEFISKACSIN